MPLIVADRANDLWHQVPKIKSTLILFNIITARLWEGYVLSLFVILLTDYPAEVCGRRSPIM